MNDVSVKHPEWLDIDVNGTISHGYDQEWFDDEWQRLSGGGVYKTQWMERGLSRLFDDKNLPYEVHMLNVSPFSASRVEVEAAAQFIHDALSQDVPVAFLNRHKGKEPALYTWHWVPIYKMFMDGDDIRCGIFDEGEIRDFSLVHWLKDTILGGGFCYITKR